MLKVTLQRTNHNILLLCPFFKANGNNDFFLQYVLKERPYGLIYTQSMNDVLRQFFQI